MVWAGGRSCAGSSWVSPALQVSGDTGQLLSLLSSHTHCHRFSPPCKITTLSSMPQSCSISVPGRKGSGCPGGMDMEGRAVGSTWGMPGWAGSLGLALATRDSPGPEQQVQLGLLPPTIKMLMMPNNAKRLLCFGAAAEPWLRGTGSSAVTALS